MRASLQWYEDVFALHGIPTAVDDGLWRALAEPPRWHSAAKTLRPDVSVEQVVEAVAGFGPCSVADSYGTLDLTGVGFERLFTASWLHRAPLPPDACVAAGMGRGRGGGRARVAGTTPSTRPGCCCPRC